MTALPPAASGGAPLPGPAKATGATPSGQGSDRAASPGAASVRASAMEEQIVRQGRGLGIADDGLALVTTAHALAMEPRRALLPDEHHPDFLHPGRTLRVLLGDVGLADPDVLAAAALAETRRGNLAVAEARIVERLGTGIAAWVREVPGSLQGGLRAAGAAGLAERLVTAGETVRLVALSERLDQLRHAHLWEDRSARRRAHREAEEVYLPVAERTHALLARRFAWWCRMFRARHL